MLLPSLWKALPLVALVPHIAADPAITSKSLNPCLANSGFSATLFLVALTPNNRSLSFDVEGVSTISGNVNAEVELLVYGYSALKQQLDPCDEANKDLVNLCPMITGSFTLNSNLKDISTDIMSNIPGTSASSRALCEM
jgi:hypothetical protein